MKKMAGEYIRGRKTKFEPDDISDADDQNQSTESVEGVLKWADEQISLANTFSHAAKLSKSTINTPKRSVSVF